MKVFGATFFQKGSKNPIQKETTMEKIKQEAKKAIEELIEVSGIKTGEILVVGCSSSEMTGGTIGKTSAPEVAKELFEAIYPILCEKGIYLAAQCCEHLNRALIIERECAEKYGLEEVCVVPQIKAGGSFATAVYDGMKSPVAVEKIQAHAGMDIGSTLIGMHLKSVAVPVRLENDYIGSAKVLAARTRPKFIGGERAVYDKSKL